MPRHSLCSFFPRTNIKCNHQHKHKSLAAPPHMLKVSTTTSKSNLSDFEAPQLKSHFMHTAHLVTVLIEQFQVRRTSNASDLTSKQTLQDFLKTNYIVINKNNRLQTTYGGNGATRIFASRQHLLAGLIVVAVLPPFMKNDHFVERILMKTSSPR